MTINKIFKKEENLMWIIAILVGMIIILSLFPNIVPKFNYENKYKVKIIEISGDCKDCFDLSALTKGFEKSNIKLEKENIDYRSEEAEKLIEKYSIKRIPALIIISKNLEKIGLDNNVFSLKENYAVFDKSVPYLDLNSGEIMGIVDLKEVSDSKCLECKSLSGMKEQFKSSGIKVRNYEVVPAESEAGKLLIKENNLSFLPALLTSKNIEEYWWIFPNIISLLDEKEDYFAFKNPAFPYKEISTGKIKGKVGITYLENKSCLECFNASILKEAFQEIGVYIDREVHIDISSAEGKALVKNYNITGIPTIILSDEISDYLAIKGILEKVGTYEGKKFVFRKLDVLNAKYQKLEGG